MRYTSTRSKQDLDFAQVVLQGLAEDGGLYMPRTLPKLDASTIASFADKSYTEIAYQVMLPFVGQAIPEQDFLQIVKKSYENFDAPDCCALHQLNDSTHILELFHGPSFAFKDYALQFLGLLVDYFLAKQGKKAIILGATSGDTGSAAIVGCQHMQHADIVILHPKGAVSEIQRLQMTTNLMPHVHNLAFSGDFDDCQNAVKHLFNTQNDWLQDRRLIAINSINFARIMAQIVYYFYASSRIENANYAVPTGNFGDILAGFFAKQMGAKIGKLTITSNANNILHRCLQNNDYSLHALEKTLSPSMDIMISSNFERLIYWYSNHQTILRLSQQLKTEQKMVLPQEVLQRLRADFTSTTSSDEQIIATMQKLWKDCGYIVDPHTATAVQSEDSKPRILLATAHPAKFPLALERAGLECDIPRALANLVGKQERCHDIADRQELLQYMRRFA